MYEGCDCGDCVCEDCGCEGYDCDRDCEDYDCGNTQNNLKNKYKLNRDNTPHILVHNTSTPYRRRKIAMSYALDFVYDS